jgi:hypothetical protein
MYRKYINIVEEQTVSVYFTRMNNEKVTGN